jgi:hypothetical protein
LTYFGPVEHGFGQLFPGREPERVMSRGFVVSFVSGPFFLFAALFHPPVLVAVAIFPASVFASLLRLTLNLNSDLYDWVKFVKLLELAFRYLL